MLLQLLEDCLGIKVLLVLVDKVLPHISVEDTLKHRVDELLLIIEEGSLFSRRRMISWTEDFLRCTSPCSGDGEAVSLVPLFIILEKCVVRLFSFDVSPKFLSRGEHRSLGGDAWLTSAEDKLWIPVGAASEGIKVSSCDPVKVRWAPILNLVPQNIFPESLEEALLGKMQESPPQVFSKGCKVRGRKGSSTPCYNDSLGHGEVIKVCFKVGD